MGSKDDDRLSSLPNDALKVILSFLPTKSATATTILSSSWRDLWTDITALRFTINNIPTPQFDTLFFHVLRRVTWQKIEAAELNIEPPLSSKPPNNAIVEAIRYIVCNGPSVKDVKINFIGTSSYLVTLPNFIYQKKSIEVLELHGFMLEGAQVNFKLHSLRKLVISVLESDLRALGNLVKSCPWLEVLRVRIDVSKKIEHPIEIMARKLKWLNIILCYENAINTNKVVVLVDVPKLESLEVVGMDLAVKYTPLNLRKLFISVHDSELQLLGNLIKSCPLLETLLIHVLVSDKFGDPIEIKAPKLKSLSIRLSVVKASNKNKVVIDAPKLDYFEVYSPIMLKLCFLQTPIDLAEARVVMGEIGGSGTSPNNPKQGLSTANPIFRVRILKLSGDIVRSLSFLEYNVKMFHQLTHLEMGLSSSRGWKGVKRFLQSCPNLESLVLRREGSKWDDTKWSDIDIVPCLMSKLEKIELLDFYGTEKDLKLIIMYIINFAKALKSLYFTTNFSTALKILYREFVKHSMELRTCQVNLTLECSGDKATCCIQEGQVIRSTP